MATVTGLTAARMLEIEAASVVDGDVVGNDLVLTRHDGTQISAGNVRGLKGDAGTPVNYASPVFTGVVKLPIVAYTPAAGASGGPLQRFDNVCAFSSDTGFPVGAIVLRAPYGLLSHMERYDIVGYGYEGSTGVWGAAISFYSNGGGPAFTYPVVEYTGKFQPQIRLAREISSGNIVIIIGDVATAWAYPKVQILSAFLGLNAVADTYMNGWQSSLVTSLTAYDVVTTPFNVSFSAKMPAPTTTTATGTVTATTVETRDAILGNYVFTAVAGHSYRVCLDNLHTVGTVAAEQYGVRVRNGGSTTPTAASTMIAQSRSVIYQAGGALPVSVGGLFTPAAGVQTLSVFLVRLTGTTGTAYIWSTEMARQLYVIDLGA